ncbi:MAG: UDP-N-acetylmuramoyl-tripeptide--D-alanyl-D-alanine ligase [Acidimicrobiia bacterium]|nr:UDP-N-acetylmuramoyl-tripeptide--D-alanyl-D-alanine ligase [Acidimicrobiia bacterium]
MDLTAGDIAAATRGELVGPTDAIATSMTIDSRVLLPGAGFVALRGERDGHDFVADAFARGASLAVTAVRFEASMPGATLVCVDDTMQALTDMAHLARSRVRDATVVGITGSAGKTATKDLTAAALGRTRRVHASPSSFNNEAGVPLTLIGAPDDVEVVVVEMGARFNGNIADLAVIAQPQVGVITHIGMAHAEHLGGRTGIARVKGELLEALPANGLAVLNAECDATDALARRTAARVIRVGRSATSDVRAVDVTLDGELHLSFVLESAWGTAPVVLGLRGEHQVENALEAAAVALELGVPLDDVAAGLAEARTATRRMDLVRTAGGVLVINDAYNSSPTSAAAAVRSLASLDVPGRRIAVLGEMLEIGDASDAEHEAIGALAAASGIDVLIAVGRQSERFAAGASGSRVSVLTVADRDEALEAVMREVQSGDAVLVKASRAVGLERVAESLTGAS